MANPKPRWVGIGRYTENHKETGDYCISAEYDSPDGGYYRVLGVWATKEEAQKALPEIKPYFAKRVA